MEIKVSCEAGHRHVVNIPTEDKFYSTSTRCLVVRDTIYIFHPLYSILDNINHPLSRCKSCKHSFRCITNKCDEKWQDNKRIFAIYEN